MMASTLALRLIESVGSGQWAVASKDRAASDFTDHWPLPTSLPPVIPYFGLLLHHCIKSDVLAQENLSKQPVLTQLNCLQAHQLKQRQEHAHQRLSRLHVSQNLFQAQRPIFQRQTTAQIHDHLTHGDGFFIHLEDWLGADAFQNLLERFHQIDYVRGNLWFGSLGLHEVANGWIRPYRVFELLFLHQHLRCGFELFVLDETIHQFGAGVVVGFRGRRRITRQQHLRLDVNQNRSHVDKLGGDVHIQFAKLFYVGQILAGNFRNRYIVDIDVLFADEVEQQVERAFIDAAYADREREVVRLLLRGDQD